MKPEELKQIALDSAKPEVDFIMGLMKQAAENKEKFLVLPLNNISEISREVLIEKGFKITRKTHRVPGLKRIGAVDYWEIFI